ncbi:uncharacterized protein Triagg1_10884 [Trichoderma aggressivum f. europaeum]|uniref:Uncharacterized protein n=1 Tax=Trichoderma aggressivum f. europaeum TaxID=173218 RepID=A0AAE1LUV9_9HYPO|nr:hypothetical protein Triagg1_10884 [Trichoderma aggressivum f. europaeum]
MAPQTRSRAVRPPKKGAATAKGNKYFEYFLKGKQQGAWVSANEFPTQMPPNPPVPPAQSLAEAYHYRVPTMNVRQEWPTRHGLTTGAIPPRDAARLAAEFPGLQKTGRFVTEAQVGGLSWNDHLFEVRKLLLDFHNNQWANSFGLAAMLHIIGQGVPSTAVMDAFIDIDDTSVWTNSSVPGRATPDLRILLGRGMVNADLPGQGYTNKFRDSLYGRRFIVTLFHFHNPQHWVAAVFDRVAATLLIFDTLRDNQREARSRAAALAWREFGVNLGFPCDIHAVAPPLPAQPSGWECGYLGLLNISLCIRSLLGVTIHECLQTNLQQFEIMVDEFEQPNRVQGFGGAYISLPETPLPIPDWHCGGGNKDGWMRASTFLFSIFGNELGFQTKDDLDIRLGTYDAKDKNPIFFEFYPGFLEEGCALQIGKVGRRRWDVTQKRRLPDLYKSSITLRAGLDNRTKPRARPGWKPPAETTMYPQLVQKYRLTAIDQLFRRRVR